MMKHVPMALFAILVILPLTTLGPGSAVALAEESGSRPASEQGDHRIGPEDVLDIAVWNNTAISRTVPVRPDGKISLPLLNDVQAAGLTPMQLRDVLIKKLAEYTPTPEVWVIIRELHSFKVSVIGAVKTPGRRELKSRATVVDLLAMRESIGAFGSRVRL